MLQRDQKFIETLAVFELKIGEEHEHNASKNTFFFRLRFVMVLGGFGQGFGKALGRGLESFWHLLGHFWLHFRMLVFCMSSKRSLGGSWA